MNVTQVPAQHTDRVWPMVALLRGIPDGWRYVKDVKAVEL